jgi:hypothetical protein
MAFSWFTKKKPSIDVENIVYNINRISSEYGAFLEHNSVTFKIIDENKLPHPKESILTALCVSIQVNNGTKNEIEALAVCAQALAFFQKGVGDHPLHQLGVDISKFDLPSMSGENLSKLILSNPAGKERYEHFLPLVQADTLRIEARIEEANRQRRQAL